MSLPKNLKPKKNYFLSRIGKNNDGGYLVGKKKANDSINLISLGISNDWSFEDHFLKLYSNTKIFAFDDSLNFMWILKKCLKNSISFIFFSPAITLKILKNDFYTLFFYYSIKKKFNLKLKRISYNDIIKISKNKQCIQFKIDIEGSEYRILEDLIKIRNKISGIVIEFHDIDLHIEKIKNFIKKIDLTLVHIHPNNYSEPDRFGNPTSIELTLEKKPIIKNHDKIKLPNLLDQKCDTNNKDYTLRFR
tara:strand:+ start:1209 stop:1952 length:744 start_codon:yes stop_codon:yes gene_type:complete